MMELPSVPCPPIIDFHPDSAFLSSFVKVEVTSKLITWVRLKHLEGITESKCCLERSMPCVWVYN